jgi:hypothetical protein
MAVLKNSQTGMVHRYAFFRISAALHIPGMVTADG